MKKERYKLTVDFVNENFYEINGLLYRKNDNGKNIKEKTGYYKIFFKGKFYLSHRILWILYNQQEIPQGYVIDHIDNNLVIISRKI